MITAADFRRLALSMPGAVESSHMDHPDFRVGNRIFATLSGDETWGMVKLTPETQRFYLAAAPTAFVPAKGAWGAQGSTMVRLSAADEASVHEAMETAWRSAAAKAQPRKKRAR